MDTSVATTEEEIHRYLTGGPQNILRPATSLETARMLNWEVERLKAELKLLQFGKLEDWLDSDQRGPASRQLPVDLERGLNNAQLLLIAEYSTFPVGRYDTEYRDTGLFLTRRGTWLAVTRESLGPVLDWKWLRITTELADFIDVAQQEFDDNDASFGVEILKGLKKAIRLARSALQARDSELSGHERSLDILMDRYAVLNDQYRGTRRAQR